MTVNKHLPHVLVLPEDDANRQIANGFMRHLSVDERRTQILDVARGWPKILKFFRSGSAYDMRGYTDRIMVLLVDSDRHAQRVTRIRGQIPTDLQSRVFVLGTWSDPEDLRAQVGTSYEQIGEKLADCCRNAPASGAIGGLWSHRLLDHNSAELGRIAPTVRQFLFR